MSPAEQRKAWVRDTAAAFVRASKEEIKVNQEERRAQAFRAVDMATLIWTLTNGGDMDSAGNGVQ